MLAGRQSRQDVGMQQGLSRLSWPCVGERGASRAAASVAAAAANTAVGAPVLLLLVLLFVLMTMEESVCGEMQRRARRGTGSARAPLNVRRRPLLLAYGAVLLPSPCFVCVLGIYERSEGAWQRYSASSAALAYFPSTAGIRAQGQRRHASFVAATHYNTKHLPTPCPPTLPRLLWPGACA